ncbi:putative ribonuclease H-like domain-containing protein [Tanacetum coccineum]
MASMKYYNKHNQVGFLKKPEENTGFAEIVDFLKGSHIRYALTQYATIYDSLVKQFWQTVTATTLADRTLELSATIDTLEYTITEASIRSKLQLTDASGISMLPNNEIFEGMGNMGPKSGRWDQFGSNIATALICLSTGRIYNFSKLILDGMVENLKSKTKLLMYPRFLQMILEIQTESKYPYFATVLNKKIFGNMKRGFRGVPRPLLPAMLPVVVVDQSAGQADQAVTQPSPSEPLPTSSHPPVISATTESEPTPVAESIAHPISLTPEPDNEPIEHTFEQPSPEHQPISPRHETEIPQSQDLTHPPVAEERTMTVDDLLQLVPKLITKVDSLETELKQTKLTMEKAIVKLVKKGRNLQEEGLDEIVSPEGLEAAETLAKVLTQRTKTYTRKVKTGLMRKLDADEVSTGEEINTGFTDVSTAFTDVNTAFEEIKTGDESIIPSLKKGQRKGKAMLEEKSQSKRTKTQIIEEQTSLAEIARLQAQEEAEDARKAELQRQDALIAKRMQDEYVVPTGKDNVIVSTGRTKVIPAGRTILVLSLPENHMADFHHLDDARDIWLDVKARFGGNDESKKMRKSMLKQEFSEFRVSESEGLHKGYDRALPPSWSQVAITLKTKGGLDYLSFDDLYNKLRTLEIDVKGGSSYDSRGTSAPTHSAFISAASTNSKMSYPDQSHSTTFTSASSSPTASSNVMENIGKLDLEELDIKWQMAMLFVRINIFEKKVRRKMKFNNKDAARFDKKKVKCYKCSELGHFARECTGKQLDSKARYSSFKLKELDKSEEPKALLSVDSMLNWSDHEGEDVENGAAQVYGMIAGAEDDAAGSATGDATGDVADDVSNAAAEFALMGISSQVQAYKSTLQTLEQQKGWYQSNQLALEERIRILTANLENTTNMLKYTEKLNEQAKLEKLNDKVRLEGSKASIFDTTPEYVAEKPLYDRFVKAVGMHAVPPPITGTFMPPSNNPDLDDTQFTYGSKSNNYFETNYVSNDFVSCDNSDNSSDSKTTGFASCVSSVKSSSSKTNEPLASAPSSVAFQIMSETANQQPSSTNDNSSFSFKKNVKPPRNSCNKSGVNSRSLCKRKSFGSKTCFVCGSKFHLIKDCDFYEKRLELQNKPMWNNVANIPSFVPNAASVPAGSRNRQPFVPAGSRNRLASVPAGSRNRPTSVLAGRPFSAGWKNNAARPMTKPTSHYCQHFSRLGYYNSIWIYG